MCTISLWFNHGGLRMLKYNPKLRENDLLQKVAYVILKRWSQPQPCESSAYDDLLMWYLWELFDQVV